MAKLLKRRAEAMAEITETLGAFAEQLADLDEADEILDWWRVTDTNHPGWRQPQTSQATIYVRGINNEMAERAERAAAVLPPEAPVVKLTEEGETA